MRYYLHMPELPEVETVRKQLSQEMIGASIVSIEIRASKVFMGDPTRIYGDKIVRVGRVGKYLFVHLASGRGLAIHLKMTGRMVMNVEEYGTSPHTRVVLSMADGRSIFYWDTRMFGYLHVEDDIALAEEKVKQKLGPEPWVISDTEFLRRLQKTGRAVKEAILDQSLLAGVGNIYANDGLWLARIDPRRKANTLKLSEVKKLRASLCTVMERGLATGGASDNSYVDAYGKRGTYQDEFLVYSRTGKPCLNCDTPLKRIVVGGRGTWVCTQCQH
jgi:formamidopyrimidine-DNA glycosylase